MKGAPLHDLSSKHGTNANFKKSGAPLMKGLGKMAGNFIKGKGPLGFMNPVGMAANKLGAFGKGDQNQVQNQNAVAQNTPPTPPPTAGAPVPTPEEQGVAGPMTMKKKAGAPMKDLSGDGKITKKDVLIGRGVIKKPGAPLMRRRVKNSRNQLPPLINIGGKGRKRKREESQARFDKYVADSTASENARKATNEANKKTTSKTSGKKVGEFVETKTTSRVGSGLKPGAPMKKSPMEKGGDGCGGNFKVNKPGTVVSRAFKRVGGDVKRRLDNVVDNIKKGNKKRKKKRNTVKAPKNTGGGGHIVRSSTSYN